MQDEFEMSKVAKLSYFLGFQIKQLDEGVFISRSKYAKNVVKKFGLEKVSIKRTPTPTYAKISKDTRGTLVDGSLYINITGSLLYLTISKPDIIFVVGVVQDISPALELVTC